MYIEPVNSIIPKTLWLCRCSFQVTIISWDKFIHMVSMPWMHVCYYIQMLHWFMDLLGPAWCKLF